MKLALRASTFGENRKMHFEHKYAKVEWERRFLLDRFPAEARVTRVRRITDRYIEGTRLRLRQQGENKTHIVFKLTQKLAGRTSGARQGLITTMYITKEEFDVLAKLPAKLLSKTRHSVPPFGIDVFEGELHGLIMAEAEFNSDEEAAGLTLPSFIRHEVTDDLRFRGGSLVSASQNDLREWVAEYGFL
jgi:CYTH domain-containing protein